MPISTINNSISRLQKEVADIQKKISLEHKKESDCNSRIFEIDRSITKNTSLSTIKSKQLEIQRKQNEIAKIRVRIADFYKQISDRESKLLKLKSDLIKEEEKERKKQAQNEEKERKKLLELEKKQQKEQLAFQKKLQSELNKTQQLSKILEHENNIKVNSINKSLKVVEYDLFISHASEDKEEFVRPLAEELKKLGVNVWYDEFSLRVGDNLRECIDHGLGKSKFGTIIVSSAFCSKNWTQYEFDSMITREMNGHKMILPIWHKVTKNDVINFSPALANKVALNTSIQSIEEIAQQLADVIFNN